ncbi:cuticle protein AMP4-like [Penaeus vannamei]|uniref:cuticle protein AMP4-like n=1 Tax=Penaeus vannamei TaxID=6689 RepID=UPI00387F46E2
MRVLFLAAALVLAAAAPQEPRPIAILLNERVAPEGGAYSFKIETENGIVQSEEGAPGLEGQTNVQGVFSFPMEDGSIAEVRYLADENGFQAQSPLLPVAPEFPHPIPQFVLDQIAFAEEQDRLEAQGQLLKK